MIRKIAAASLVAGAVLVPTAAHAGATLCTLNVFAATVGGSVNCYLDTVGHCTYQYDPVMAFPSSVAPETTQYASCLAL